jgi:1-acyl-sn-glycerol-3-phosphate acyltransferase
MRANWAPMKEPIQIPWFHYFANAGMRTIFPLLLKADMQGVERTPKNGPAIVAINHTCFLDPLLSISYLRQDILPMAKIELFEFPFGPVFHNYGAFPVRRGEGDLSAMRRALQILREGHMMLISPEGTRTKTGTLQAPHEGIALIAIKSGAPILPVAIWGGKMFWHNIKRLRRTPVGMRVGEPLAILPLQTKPTRELLRAITDELMYYIARMLPAEYRGRYSDVENVTPRYVMLQRDVLAQSKFPIPMEVMSMQG